VDKGVHVLGKAGAAVAQPGLEERAADAAVHSHALHHLGDVGARRLADVGDRVDEGDLGGEERVGRVFDDLRRGQVGDDHGPLEGGVELDQFHGGLLVGRPDHDAIGPQGVLDGRALTEELGVGNHVVFDGPALMARNDLTN
jgi:hypothetical protein